ncbi:unnamed protein product [Brassica oleracea]|uniref:(rape) hypothetical protein n=1 Tax=Brassica napus TaxID=3708 RepID=A0A816JDH4_BRANA|nr:unnamed protein product [Brassica napus]
MGMQTENTSFSNCSKKLQQCFRPSHALHVMIQSLWCCSFQVSASAAASMRTVVVRFADADAAAAAAAAAYYIATADFIGVSRRTRRSDAASDAVSCVNETNKS